MYNLFFDRPYATNTEWKLINFPAGIGQVDAAGDITLSALDNAAVYANVKLVSLSVTTNDGGLNAAQESLNDFIHADFKSSEGSVQIQFGDKVRLADDYGSPAYTTDDDTHAVGVGTRIQAADGYDTARFTSDSGRRLVLTGDTVQLADDFAGGGDAGRIYKHIGMGGAGLRLDLGAQDYGDMTKWARIGGEAGVVYEWEGILANSHAALGTVDLGTIDFNAPGWKKIGGGGAIYEYLGST